VTDTSDASNANGVMRWLRENNRSQSWLARELGLSVPVVNQWLMGNDTLAPLHLENIAVATNREIHLICTACGCIVCMGKEKKTGKRTSHRCKAKKNRKRTSH